MQIKPEQVKRDKYGYWTHSQLPDFGESVGWRVINQWAKNNRLSVILVFLETDAPEAVASKYFDDGDPDVSNWMPTPPNGDSFLLSIHDSDDGPLAWFAVPNKK